MRIKTIVLGMASSLLFSSCLTLSILTAALDAQMAAQEAQELEESALQEATEQYNDTYVDAVYAQQEARPQNVILIIGDGMGVPQVYASIVAQRGDNSAFLRFPFSGFSRTYSLNKYRTDSSAGGTALTTGQKVENYHVNWAPDSTRYRTIFDDAVAAGLSTGFVVTSTVLDATPASTYGHVPYRKMFDTLSLQLSQCSHSIMIGGGRKYFLPENRKDGVAPLDTLAKRGYTVVNTFDEVTRFGGDKLVALLYDDDPLTAPSRGDVLLQGSKKAIAMLSRNPKGFALMIEGSQIDWACHNNDSAYLRAELADFELMLNAVLDFAERDGNTLVVVTADHETGGLTLPDGDIEKGYNDMRFLWGNHTGCMVPVFAYGPGSDYFSGVQQNTDIPRKIRELMGW
ncbi:MAG: alkaline phosphatase [Bacteroidales bacterium]|nr:alkaline phosphatase [Bacteroidales bacterium]